MRTYEWNWKSFDGLDMYARGWVPEGKPKAVICLLHGLGEHIGRYEHVAEAMTQKGYAMLGFDLRGHGKSGGQRGHTPSYDALMDDITAFLAQVEERYPGIPRFLYGHSMGGNLALNYVLRHTPDLNGIITTGTWLKLAFQPPASKVALGKMMNNVLPGFSQTNGLETAALSRDVAVVTAYVSDPLVHNKISARLFISIFENGLLALEHAAEFPLPLLLMHGAADRVISVEACKEFAEKAGKKVTFKLWEDFYHEIHNEPGKAEVFKFMTDWLDAQLPG